MEGGVLGHGDGVVPLDVIGIFEEFQDQVVAGDDVEPALAGFFEYPLDGFSLQPDADLREVIEWTVETAAIEE